METNYLKIDDSPEMTKTSSTKEAYQLVDAPYGDDLLDCNDAEAEEDTLQQYVVELMVPNLRYSSLQALSAPNVDLLSLTSTRLWDSLCKGFQACLASNNKQSMALTTSLIISLYTELSKVSEHACIGQLFGSIAHAAAQAVSVRHCEAIWLPCLPIVKSLAHQLPQTCIHYSESLLTDVAEAFCELLSVCIEGKCIALQGGFVGNMSLGCPMDWWHSWLARAKLAKVLPACLTASGLLHQALDVTSQAAPGDLPVKTGRPPTRSGNLATAVAELLAVHVLGGALSLHAARMLFPLLTSADKAECASQISVEQALQALIAVQQSKYQSVPNMTTPSHLLTPATTAPAPNLPAADVPATEAPAAKQLAASLLQEPKQVVGSAHSAAFQVLQSLSLQHSSRLQRIYNSSNLQQLLQPCLDVLHQQQRAGNDAICKASMAQVKARQAMSKAEGSALLGSSKAHDMPQQQWSLIRDSWDLVANLCQTAFGCEVVMEASLEDRLGGTVNVATAAASVFHRILVQEGCSTLEHCHEAKLAALRQALRAVHELVQSSAAYEAVDKAGIPDMLIRYLDTLSADCDVARSPYSLAVADCLIRLCSRPLLALRISVALGPLTICANRVTSQMQVEDQSDWLYQASSLALTEAGQRALLKACLPQGLLQQLQQLPMHVLDDDTGAMRGLQYAEHQHRCQVVMSWYGFAEQLLSADTSSHCQPAQHGILEGLTQAAMQVSPCPVSSSSPDCPALPTLEGAEAALRLLGTACRSWRCRWLLDAHLNLAHRLTQQLEKQEKEAGLAIIDITTAPRQQLLGMLQAEQGCASGNPSTAQGTPTGQQQSCACRATTAKPGAVTGQEAQRLSLSELSVSDPGMRDPQNWWLSAQQALLEGIEQGQLQWSALPLVLQRTVMVAMKALAQEGPFLAACCQQEGGRLWLRLKATGGEQSQVKSSMTAACQTGLQALLTQAKQQLPTLARRLTALQLQDFLCTMHTMMQSVTPASVTRIPDVQEMDCYASIVWLIMKGDHVTQEFLTALTASQAAMYLWPAWGKLNAGQVPQQILTHCLCTMIKEELPLLHAAFAQSGCHVGHLVSLWHEQSFLGILHLPDVVSYVTMGLLLGPDWMLYFMLAVLQQQEHQVRQQWLDPGIVCDGLMPHVEFDLQRALPVMEGLQDKWSEELIVLLKRLPDTYL